MSVGNDTIIPRLGVIGSGCDALSIRLPGDHINLAHSHLDTCVGVLGAIVHSLYFDLVPTSRQLYAVLVQPPIGSSGCKGSPVLVGRFVVAVAGIQLINFYLQTVLLIGQQTLARHVERSLRATV